MGSIIFSDELKATIQQLTVRGKGLLAADESDKTIAKRFATINLASTPETHRQYRELFFTTPGINEFIAGVILYDETIRQSTKDGKPFPILLQELGIVPGIKVDKGVVPLPGTDNETITEGLDGLAERLAEYKKLGARFAKWRGVISITNTTPSSLGIMANAHALAQYAAICQTAGIVPIVEPEVLLDGDHTLDRCKKVCESVLRLVFVALAQHKVLLEAMILKPSMVLSGKDHQPSASTSEVAEATISVLRRTVPAAVPSINFLSGGQSPEQATTNLNAINNLGSQPWNIGFSYARALQEPALNIWLGKPENVAAAQQAFYFRAQLNSAASLGRYTKDMEK